jgi:hypothetical protein
MGSKRRIGVKKAGLIMIASAHVFNSITSKVSRFIPEFHSILEFAILTTQLRKLSLRRVREVWYDNAK